MDETVLKIALAGLLHDIGKFMQRAELEKEFPEIKDNYPDFCPNGNSYLHAAHTAYFIQKFIPDSLFDKAELNQAAHHHVSGQGDLYREADCISSGMERYGDEVDPENFKEVRLHSIFDMVELQYAIRGRDGRIISRWRHRLAAECEKITSKLFPVFSEDGAIHDEGFTYRRLWEEFSGEVEALQSLSSVVAYFNDLYWLLEKYTSCIPSATNAFPDISLFDHAKTTAAIASSLYMVSQEKVTGQPEFMLYSGDISGIQEYIFKISQSQGVGSIAKRLRGRSFFVAMISEVFSRYIIEGLGLTQANVNFCGGGNFELLLPTTSKALEKINVFEHKSNDWLLKQFHGELGFVGARVRMTRHELRTEYPKKKDELGDALNVAKMRKFRTHGQEESFWREHAPNDGRLSVCRSCNLQTVPSESETCYSCDQEKNIGEMLPKARYLSFSTGKPNRGLSLPFGEFGYVTLAENKADILNGPVYSLAEENTGVKAFYRLARSMPVALEPLELDTEKDEIGNKSVRRHQPLSFTTLADMATGDKRIAILKMDVDNLGYIFSMGLEAPATLTKQGNLHSISRLSTLSRQITAFFTNHLDAICWTVFERWQKDPENRWQYKNSVSNIFYLIFAGGDDLLIVGPWDRIIELAREIRREFKDFTCHNPNVTLSAGIYICKPKYPIGHAVGKAEEALKQSKDWGRNRISVMGETAVWAVEDKNSRTEQEGLKKRYAGFDRNEIGSEIVYMEGKKEGDRVLALTFEELSDFTDRLQGYLSNGQVSRGFIRSLLKARKQFFAIIYNDQSDRYEEDYNLMFLPHLLYIIERNVSKDVRVELKVLLVTSGDAPKYIRQALYPSKYLLMKTR